MKTENKLFKKDKVDIKPGDIIEVIIDEPSEEVKQLQKVIFNIKFDYDTLLNFTQQLLTHEQHILFAAKKKEIFG